MNDLKFAFRQMLKNRGFTVHPPQFVGTGWSRLPQCSVGRFERIRQNCYGGRAVAVLTLALGIGANRAINGSILSSADRSDKAIGESCLEPGA